MTDFDQASDSLLTTATDGSAPAPARVRGRPFVKGHPGGPGRPRGSRNHTTRLLDELVTGQAEAIVEQIVKRAW